MTKTCPAPECGKPIADTSMCCLRHWKQLPYGVRHGLGDISELADRIWRSHLYPEETPG